jgi:beta-galactosidase
VTLDAPDGWTIEPVSSTVYTVTPPSDLDFGDYPLSATVDYVSPPGFSGRVTAGATVHAPLPEGFAWFSDLPYTALENGWGPVERDMSNGEQPAGDGRTLSIGGTAYAKGLGAHAVSRVQLALDGRCSVFRSDVGVDDEMGANGSVAFEVWVDGVRRAATGVLTGSAAAERLDVDVTGGQLLELRITDGGNGNGADHGDWAAARLACT